MPYNVPLTKQLRNAGWRATVFDAEGPETPHVSVLFKGEVRWRVSLRDQRFLIPPGGGWGDMPEGLREAILRDWEALRLAWDIRFPHNPIESKDDDENNA